MADGTQRGLAAIVSADVVGYSRFMGVDETGHNSLSNKGNQIWVIREKKTKARRNNRKRPNVVQKRNENRKEKRRNKLSVTFFACHFILLEQVMSEAGGIVAVRRTWPIRSLVAEAVEKVGVCGFSGVR